MAERPRQQPRAERIPPKPATRAIDTADFDDEAPGNLRVDYVLPSAGLKIVDAGVFWSLDDEPGAAFLDASDHRLVWVDVTLPPR